MASALLCALTACSSSSSAPSRFSLNGLGSTGTVVSGSDPNGVHYRGNQASLSVQLPTGARQGQDGWYTFHLHARLDLIEPLADGDGVQISAATADHPAIQAGVTSSGTTGGLHFGAADQVDGPKERMLPWNTLSIPIDVSNYLQVAGVSGGRVPVAIGFYSYPTGGTWKVKALTVLPDTSVDRIAQSPTPLTMETSPKLDSRVGQPLEISYQLVSADRRTDGPIDVKLLIPDEMRALGPLQVTVPAASGRAPRTGKFTVVGKVPGPYTVVLTARSPVNFPYASISIQVHP